MYFINIHISFRQITSFRARSRSPAIRARSQSPVIRTRSQSPAMRARSPSPAMRARSPSPAITHGVRETADKQTLAPQKSQPRFVRSTVSWLGARKIF